MAKKIKETGVNALDAAFSIAPHIEAFWFDRMQNMVFHAARASFPDCVNATTPLIVESVPTKKQWPMNGKIVVRRVLDGRRMALALKAGKFTVTEVRGR